MRICNVHKINAYFIAIIVFIELLLSMLCMLKIKLCRNRNKH